MAGFINPFRTPKSGDSGLDIRFLESLVAEVRAIGSLVFSQRFSITNLGNGGRYVDVVESSNDVLVKVSANDTVSDYLDNKVVVVAPIVKTVLNDGGDEDLQLSLDDDLGGGAGGAAYHNSKRKVTFETYALDGELKVQMVQGKVYFKGVSKTITSWPADSKVTITDNSTLWGWIYVELASGNTYFATGAADPGDGDDDTEYFRIFKAVASSGVITEVLECQHGDIHCMGNA